MGNHVPSDIDLLYHLCYGDSGHKHVVEPTDMSDMVEFANRVSRLVERSIQLFHMPVPRNRSDDDYFAPLRRLRLRPETELCLGLVHYTDGVEGTKRRLETAKRHVSRFSIATECGFGRRDPSTLPELLRIHAAFVHPDHERTRIHSFKKDHDALISLQAQRCNGRLIQLLDLPVPALLIVLKKTFYREISCCKYNPCRQNNF